MISVIIPALNESDQIVAFLEHLQGFRAAGHELILVDGGSCDGTPELAIPYVDRILITSPGRAHQMNAGADVAEGQLLLFQHVDTHLPENAVHLLVALLDRSESFWGRFDVRLSPGHWLLPVVAGMMNLRSRFTQIATGDQSLFVSRDLFDEVGGFPRQPLMEDVELSTRLRRLSAVVCIRSPAITSSRRWMKHGVWKTILLMWRLRLSYFMGTSPEQLAALYYPGIKPVYQPEVIQFYPPHSPEILQTTSARKPEFRI